MRCSLPERPSERPARAELCGLENGRPWVSGKIGGRRSCLHFLGTWATQAGRGVCRGPPVWHLPRGPLPCSGRQVCSTKGCPLATWHFEGPEWLGRGHRLGLRDLGPPLSGSDPWAWGQSAPCPGLSFPIWEMRGLVRLQALYLRDSPARGESGKGACVPVCASPRLGCVSLHRCVGAAVYP